jgi:hypothetical protein
MPANLPDGAASADVTPLDGRMMQTIAEGLAQTSDYADRIGADEAHLLIFDRRSDVPWETKIWQRDEQLGTRTITVWGV